MIEEVGTGRLVTTEVHPLNSEDLRSLEPGWRFNWASEIRHAEVFKLVSTESPSLILGLISLKRCQGFIEVNLLESSPTNVGSQKKLKGIAGTLFAFAAKFSFDLGNEGFIRLTAKTQLIKHYRSTYGFIRVGNSQTMILSTNASAKLIATFDKGV